MGNGDPAFTLVSGRSDRGGSIRLLLPADAPPKLVAVISAPGFEIAALARDLEEESGDLGAVRLPDAIPLEVHVQDQAGRPLEGVVVGLGQEPDFNRSGSHSMVVIAGTTDAAGRCPFPSVMDREELLLTVLSATHVGYSEVVNLTDGSIPSPYLVQLAPGSEITGQVLNPYGHPAEGVSFEFRSTGLWIERFLKPSDGVRGNILSDRDGAFRIGGLDPEQTYSVTAHSSEWGTLTQEDAPVGSELRFRFDFKVPVSGTVLRHDGRPAAGAMVRIRPEGSSLQIYDLAADDNGRFEGQLERDEYELSVRHPSGRYYRDETISIESATDLGALSLSPGGAIRVKGRSALDGSPVNLWSLVLHPEDEEGKPKGKSEFGHDGKGPTQVLSGIPPGSYELVSDADDCAEISQMVDIIADEELHLELDFHPEARLLLTIPEGSFQTPDDFLLELRGEPDQERLRIERAWDREIRVWDIPAVLVSLWLRIGAETFFLQEVEATPGEQTIELQLPQPAQLEVIVHDKGRPIPEATVVLRPAPGDSPFWPEARATSGSDGKVLFEQVCPAAWQVSVRFSLFGLLATQEVRLQTGFQSTEIDLASVTVSGTVQGGGDPTMVALLLPTEDPNAARDHQFGLGFIGRSVLSGEVGYPWGAKCGQSGEFTARDVPAGEFQLLCISDGWYQEELVPVDTRGGAVSGVQVKLHPAARVAVRFHGTPAEEFDYVIARLVDEDGVHVGGTVDARPGVHSIPAVPPGDYRLQVVRFQVGEWDMLAEVPLKARVGSEAVADFDLNPFHED